MPDTIFIGSLRSEKIFFVRVLTLEINYHKRSRKEYRELRVAFTNVERRKFLKSLANSPSKRIVLQRAGLTYRQINSMRRGISPDGWQVHHKLPLDDNGKNDFGNLLLIKNDPYHLALNNEQSRLTKGLKEGETRQINFPVPIGFVYVPETRIAEFKHLENEVFRALGNSQLISIATHATSPTNAWNTAYNLGWEQQDCESVKTLTEIYFNYGQTVYTNLIEEKVPTLFTDMCFCECHREKEIEECKCCDLYSNKCFCKCHFCSDCDSNQNCYKEDDYCYCECHEDSTCCDDCSSLCWCGCHNCSECHSKDGDCEGASECDCICHESCDDCLNNHEDDDEDDDDDDNDDEDDDDVQVEQTSPGIFSAKLLDENKDVAGYFEYEREGSGFRCLSITWQGMDMDSITITNKYGQRQTIYDGEYFDLTIKGGGVHNFH